MTEPAQYILVAKDTDDAADKDTQIAKLKAMNEERENFVKKAMEEKEDMKTTAKIIQAAYSHDGRQIPVVMANLKAAFDDETDEAKKASIKVAMEVFEEGNGTQVNNKTQVGKEEEDVKVAVAKAIRPYEIKIMKPQIAQILQAHVNAGATEKQIQSLQKSLTAKTLSEFEIFESENRLLVAKLLVDEKPLTAAYNPEEEFNFNGQVLTANSNGMTSIDGILDGTSQ